MPDEPQLATGFVDTNVWLYAFIVSDDAQKTARASKLLKSIHPVVNVQVVNETCINLLRRNIFSEQQVAELVTSFFTKCRVIVTTESMLLDASRLRIRYSLSFWDSQIIAAALSSGTAILYSEDMQHGLVVDGKLTINNPLLDGSIVADLTG